MKAMAARRARRWCSVFLTAAWLAPTAVCAAQSGGILPSLERRDAKVAALRNVTRATVIVDQRRASVGYVLPPDTGSVALKDVELESTIELCPQMRALQGAARAASARLAEIALGTGALESELSLLRAQQRAAELFMAQFSDYELLRRAVDELVLDLDELAARIDELQTQACQAGVCPPDVESELADLTAQRASIDAERVSLDAEAAARQTSYRGAVAARDAIVAQIAAREDAYFARLDSQAALQQSLLDMYSVYARTAGGSAQIAYKSGWRDAVTRLRRDNRDLTLQKIPTRNARVHPTMIPGIGTDAYLASNPAVLEYAVNGVSVADGGPVAPLKSYPEQVKGELRLSLVSACVAAEPDAYDVELDAAGVPLFALNIGYEYPTVSPVDIAVTYNAWALSALADEAQLGVRGLSELLDRAVASGVLAFSWDTETTEFAPERRRNFELSVLYQLVQAWWTVSRVVRYDMDAVRVYGGPSEPSAGVVSPAPRTLEVRSLSGASRYRRLLKQIKLGPARPASDRRMSLVLTLGTAAELAQTALDQTMTVPPELAADGLLERMSVAKVDTAGTSRAQPDPSALVMQPVWIPSPLARDDARVVANSHNLALRSIDRSCGVYHLACRGLAWTRQTSPLPDAVKRALDQQQTVHYSRSSVSYRSAATLFRP